MKKTTLQTILILTTITILTLTPTITTAQTTPTLQINNPQGTNLNLTYTELQALPKTTITAELSCYGTPLINGAWGGVKLSDLLNQTGINGSAGSVDFVASDGYRVSLPISIALQPSVIVAYELNDLPLSEGLRLVVPDANGAIWISKITTITVSTVQIDANSFYSSTQPIANPPAAGPINSIQETQQPQATPSPTPSPTSAPKPTSAPFVPPANSTQPNSQQILPTPQPTAGALDAVYPVALGLIIAVVIVSLVVYSRNRK